MVSSELLPNLTLIFDTVKALSALQTAHWNNITVETYQLLVKTISPRFRANSAYLPAISANL
jgi:hypothetical protein